MTLYYGAWNKYGKVKRAPLSGVVTRGPIRRRLLYHFFLFNGSGTLYFTCPFSGLLLVDREIYDVPVPRFPGIYTSLGGLRFYRETGGRSVWPIRGRDAYEYDFLIEFNPAAIFRIPINSPPPPPGG